MGVPCPTCSTEVVQDDINVAKDFAYCRKCNEAFTITEILKYKVEPKPDVDLNNPPGGVWYEQTADGFVVGATTRSAIAFFLVPFMCVWSGGSLGGIYGSQILNGKFDLFASLFGIPFLIGTIIFGSIAVMAVCGRVTLTVARDEGRIFTGVGSIGLSKKFLWQDVARVYEETHRSGKTTSRRIVLEGKERITFASGLSESRRYYMLRVLQKMLEPGMRKAFSERALI
ncbi:MAG TPA: hypothetical protein VEK08_08285 [Planctomycetota bacterium]|nr:hypothetical protein [Planctomycetota bacterium]